MNNTILWIKFKPFLSDTIQKTMPICVCVHWKPSAYDSNLSYCETKEGLQNRIKLCIYVFSYITSYLSLNALSLILCRPVVNSCFFFLIQKILFKSQYIQVILHSIQNMIAIYIKLQYFFYKVSLSGLNAIFCIIMLLVV